MIGTRRRRALRRTALAVVVLAGTVVLARTPVSAATVTTTNSCKYLFDGFYRDLAMQLGGAGPAEVAPGEPVALTNGRVQATLPPELVASGYNVGLLAEGPNQIPAQVWVAVEGVGSSEGVQVQRVSATASTTVTVTGGQPAATPIDVSIALPPTTWTPTGDRLRFAQAGPGTLGSIPGVGPAGTDVAARGSVFISAQIGASIRFNLDCTPGRSIQQGNSFTAASAAPFQETAVVAPTTTAPPPPPTEAPATTPAPTTTPATTVAPTTAAPTTVPDDPGTTVVDTTTPTTVEATTTTASSTTTTDPTTTTTAEDGGEDQALGGSAEASGRDGGGSGGAALVAGLAAVVVAAGATFAWWRKRPRTPAPPAA